MTLLETIKTASLQARKDKDAKVAALLSTLISDAQMIGKNDGNRLPTDSEIMSLIKKYIVNLKETIEHLALNTADTAQLEQCTKDITVLNGFLPQQMAQEELKNAIDNILREIPNPTIKDIGKVMKSLKTNFDGQYDGKLANTLIRSILSA